MAQTNHATLSGSLKHIHACQMAGIMPICGVEVYLRDDMTIRENAEVLNAYWHLVLLAKNIRGWHNLMRATSRAYLDGFYGRPALDWSVLEACHEDLICTAACVSGPIDDAILKGDDGRVDFVLDKLLKLFGDDFALTIQPTTSTIRGW